MNRHKLGKVTFKNNPGQYTCCFRAELRTCVLKIAVIRKSPEKSFLDIFAKSF